MLGSLDMELVVSDSVAAFDSEKPNTLLKLVLIESAFALSLHASLA